MKDAVPRLGKDPTARTVGMGGRCRLAAFTLGAAGTGRSRVVCCPCAAVTRAHAPSGCYELHTQLAGVIPSFAIRHVSLASRLSSSLDGPPSCSCLDVACRLAFVLAFGTPAVLLAPLTDVSQIRRR
mmetsp:Transcript_64254/g.88873  ORF Transcript_64254/g.88873 Transcript_64254/m.88873 type:complete len:127 (-) Transcript_64254:545-925(-)